jgi:hypothetical protein
MSVENFASSLLLEQRGVVNGLFLNIYRLTSMLFLMGFMLANGSNHSLTAWMKLQPSQQLALHLSHVSV